MKSLFPSLLVVFLFFGIMELKAQLPAPPNYTLIRNLEYKTAGDWKGYLDLYSPKSGGKKALLINIHGGGWVHGTKDDQTRFAPMFTKNMIVANVEYRLAQQAPAPAAIQDVREALFFLVRNARKYDIDTDHIIVMGASAGAHLALMTGFMGNDALFSDADPADLSFRIRGIIDWYGPTDLIQWETMHKPSKASSTWLGNRGADSAFVYAISPMSQIKPGIPPVFIIHGDADKTVPYEQSTMLVDKLKHTGITYEFYTVMGGKHGNFSPLANQEAESRILLFIDEVLK